MRCSVSQAWICDRVGSNYTSLVCGTAAISAAAAASLLAYSAAAASTALAVACVRAVNAATARPTAAWAPPTAAVVGWNGCPQRRWCKDAEFSASPAPLAGRSRYLLDIDPQLTGFHPRKV